VRFSCAAKGISEFGDHFKSREPISVSFTKSGSFILQLACRRNRNAGSCKFEIKTDEPLKRIDGLAVGVQNQE
jgi:hypothetical protein